MIKVAFQIYSVIGILSPWVFLGMRWFGIFDYELDWLIFAGLFFLSLVIMFFSWKTWGDD